MEVAGTGLEDTIICFQLIILDPYSTLNVKSI